MLPCSASNKVPGSRLGPGTHAGPTTIRNVANIRIKETDRLLAVVNELRRLGQGVEHGDDWLTITPKLPVTPAAVECYADLRIAMSFAVLGTVQPGVTITDPGCCSKTYPTFFEDLATIAKAESILSPTTTQG